MLLILQVALGILVAFLVLSMLNWILPFAMSLMVIALSTVMVVVIFVVAKEFVSISNLNVFLLIFAILLIGLILNKNLRMKQETIRKTTAAAIDKVEEVYSNDFENEYTACPTCHNLYRGFHCPKCKTSA